MAQHRASWVGSVTTAVRDFVIGLCLAVPLALLGGTVGLVIAALVFLSYWYVTGERDRRARVIANRQRRRRAPDQALN